MSHDSASIVPDSQPKTLGDRLRDIAEELRQETNTQIKATSRILGAAAQMAQNHDQLIGEVVEMVEEDLEQSGFPVPYEVFDLKKEFKTLKVAKAHFGIKANSWVSLAAKLNEVSGIPASSKIGIPNTTQNEVLERLGAIEQDIKSLNESMKQVLDLLREIAEQS
jgi:hypothetical protein